MFTVTLDTLPQDQQECFLAYVKYVVTDIKGNLYGGFKTESSANNWIRKNESELLY